MSDKRNWEDLGIVWAMAQVGRNEGDNATDKVMFPEKAPHIMVTAASMPKFVEAHGQKAYEVIASKLNGTSLWVGAQRIVREYFKKGGHVRTDAERDKLMEKQYNVLILGARSAAEPQVVEKKVTVHGLPNGTEYAGTDETEYRQLLAAAYVDVGVEESLALTLAKNAKW